MQEEEEKENFSRDNKIRREKKLRETFKGINAFTLKRERGRLTKTKTKQIKKETNLVRKETHPVRKT